MYSSTSPMIWLAYVSYPVTTAVYWERALRKVARVVTFGPKIGPDVIEQWNLQNMKVPVPDQNLPLPYNPDMAELCTAVQGRLSSPDLYLWIESVPGYFPRNLDALKCPRACYLIDTHLQLQWHIQWAKLFDFTFIAQREYLPEFQRAGCQNVHWLPLACDTDIHGRKADKKHYDVGFVGSVFDGSRRAELLRRLSAKRFLLHIERCFLDEMAAVFSKSRVVFNNAVRNDLNMRVFEAMASGSFLLTDRARNCGQDELFVDGEDFGVYDDHDLIEKTRYYLIHEEEREHIAHRGQGMIHQAHTYAHRVAEVLQVCLRGQKATPTAAEWRERSLVGLESSPKWQPKSPAVPAGRSFIIPVLDASDEGRREFEALLKDLSSIEGEVIVIFNSKEAATAFSEHPRIDISASINVNSGVSRAWNIGVHLSTQPTLIFLNADVRVDCPTVETLEAGLWKLPGAAVVGPEGSCFGFYTFEDIVWLNKGKANQPVAVDAISGFFFATKRELFSRKVLRFEDDYTPCFSEEWDLGLQARQHGYRCYVVPVKGYDHKWGVSANMGRVIRYMKDGQDVAREIAARNRIRFWRKWLQIAGELQLPGWEPNGPCWEPRKGPSVLQSIISEINQPNGTSR